MSGVNGFTYRGKLEDHTNNKRVQKEFVTMTPIGPSKMGMDVISSGHYVVGASDRIAEAGSTDSRLVLTGHDIKKGDLIRLKVTANAIDEKEIIVLEIVDANTVQFDGVLSASLTTGDTFDIMRAVSQRYDESGAQITASAGLKINVNTGAGDVETNVVHDRVTPANTVPVPVIMTDLVGDLNVTAGDLNVQLTHNTAGYDSIRLGDGTNLLGINASLEALVHDADALAQLILLVAKDFGTETTLAALSAKLPATIGQKLMATSLAVTIASDQSAINVGSISGTVSLPTGASTSALQTTSNGKLDTLIAKDFATETTLATLNGKLTSLGQKANAASMPVTLSTEQEVILSAIKTAVELLDNVVAGSEMQVDLVGLGGAATDATLSAMSAKLPAALGQSNKAGSLSVTIASDQEAMNTNMTTVDFLDTGLLDTTTTNITTAGIIVVASTAAQIRKIQIVDDIGEFMTLRTGGSVIAYLPLGGGEVEVSIASGAELKLHSETGSSIVIGNIAINFLG